MFPGFQEGLCRGESGPQAVWGGGGEVLGGSVAAAAQGPVHVSAQSIRCTDDRPHHPRPGEARTGVPAPHTLVLSARGSPGTSAPSQLVHIVPGACPTFHPSGVWGWVITCPMGLTPHIGANLGPGRLSPEAVRLVPSRSGTPWHRAWSPCCLES